MNLDSGNVAWMLVASALVLFMTPGLGFFYGGLTRNKNVLATIMQSFITTGVVDSRSSSSPAVWSISASVSRTPAIGGARTPATRRGSSVSSC